MVRGQPGALGGLGHRHLPDEQHFRPCRRVVAGDQAADIPVAVGDNGRLGKIGCHQQVCVGRVDIEHSGLGDQLLHRDGVAAGGAPEIALPFRPLPGSGLRGSGGGTLQSPVVHSIHIGSKFTTEQVIVIISSSPRRGDRRTAKVGEQAAGVGRDHYGSASRTGATCTDSRSSRPAPRPASVIRSLSNQIGLPGRMNCLRAGGRPGDMPRPRAEDRFAVVPQPLPRSTQRCELLVAVGAERMSNSAGGLPLLVLDVVEPGVPAKVAGAGSAMSAPAVPSSNAVTKSRKWHQVRRCHAGSARWGCPAAGWC